MKEEGQANDRVVGDILVWARTSKRNGLVGLVVVRQRIRRRMGCVGFRAEIANLTELALVPLAG